MILQKFVENNFPSTLIEVQSKGLSDVLLDIYEITLIYHYSDSGFETVNEQLIKNKGAILSEYAKLLVEVIEKLPCYSDLVFRGTTLNRIQKQRYTNTLTTDSIIQEPYFLSTSKSKLIANLFSKGDTLFTIFSKTGRSIEKFSKFGLYSGQNEKEVLFLPNTNFEILDITQNESTTLIVLEEII